MCRNIIIENFTVGASVNEARDTVKWHKVELNTCFNCNLKLESASCSISLFLLHALDEFRCFKHIPQNKELFVIFNADISVYSCLSMIKPCTYLWWWQIPCISSGTVMLNQYSFRSFYANQLQHEVTLNSIESPNCESYSNR